MKTIVTGGAGFIGSHLVKKLIDRGRPVIIIDSPNGNLDNLTSLGVLRSSFKFIKADLTDYHEAYEAVRGAESVFHMAARIGGLSYLHGLESAELLALETNLSIDANVFRACHEGGVKRIVYPSSVAVYPMERQRSSKAVFSEKDTLIEGGGMDKKSQIKMLINPDGGYGLAKLLGELELSWMRGIKVGIGRLFSVYGTNESLERAHVVLNFIRKAVFYPEEEFIIWGNGLQNRDYVYVSDCAEALIRLEEKLLTSKVSPLVVNIGSGKATSMTELARKIISISGKDIKKIKYDKKKPVGPVSRTANISKAKKVLGWQPKVSLDEGLRRTYYWAEKKIKHC